MLYITIHDIKHIESNKAVRQNKTCKTLSTNLIEILLAAALATVTKTLDRM